VVEEGKGGVKNHRQDRIIMELRLIIVLPTTATGVIKATMITRQLIMMVGALTTAEDGTASGAVIKTVTTLSNSSRTI
jgi:cell division protein FtsL